MVALNITKNIHVSLCDSQSETVGDQIQSSLTFHSMDKTRHWKAIAQRFAVVLFVYPTFPSLYVILENLSSLDLEFRNYAKDKYSVILQYTSIEIHFFFSSSGTPEFTVMLLSKLLT